MTPPEANRAQNEREENTRNESDMNTNLAIVSAHTRGRGDHLDNRGDPPVGISTCVSSMTARPTAPPKRASAAAAE
jgi:hypothetical protein